MSKTILLTGATDGIGLETAKLLAAQGHTLLLHGRSPAKLEAAAATVSVIPGAGPVETYIADLSKMNEVVGLAQAVSENHDSLDVIINNAGILKSPVQETDDGLDIRFAVNTVAPYILTERLMPLLGAQSRVVNLSSAAQAPVNLDALAKRGRMSEMDAYAQSKLAITMWSQMMGEQLGSNGPVFIAVNPGSLLASKMVKEGYGIAGNDLSQGANILVRASLDDDFADATGKYFDNDAGNFGPTHGDAFNAAKTEAVVAAIKQVADRLIS